jgi:hypothetical protein
VAAPDFGGDFRALDGWGSRAAATCRCDPSTRALTVFLYLYGRRPGAALLRNRLLAAAQVAGFRGPTFEC